MKATIGPITAPKWSAAREYQQVFLYASIPVVLGLFVIVFFVKEEKQKNTEKEFSVTPIKLSLKEFDSNFKRFLIVVALFTLSNSTDAFLLLRAHETGIAVAVLPLL